MDIDNRLQKLSQNLTDTLLIISADHSQIDVEYKSKDYPEFYDGLHLPPSLEGRRSRVFVHDDKRECLSQRFQELFGEYFVQLSKLFCKASFLGRGTSTPWWMILSVILLQ